MDEPILCLQNNRHTFFPIKHNDIYQLYKKQLDCFWRSEEIDLSKDSKDWNALQEEEKYFIKMVLAFFASSDGIIMENLASRFLTDVTIPEARAFYSCQIMMEQIHNETYSLLIDTYISKKEEKEQLFNAVENYPCISKKADWAMKYMDEKTNNFSTRLVAFAVVEGIFFSSAFASIFWIKKKAILPGLCLSNEFISRDEALHCEFAILLYSKLERKLNRNEIYDIIKEAVEIEKEFIIEAIPCRLIGMNAGLMSNYIEFVADRLVLQLGYEKIYNTKNPFDFMQMISLERKTNFFENKVSEYALANKMIDDKVFDMTADF